MLLERQGGALFNFLNPLPYKSIKSLLLNNNKFTIIGLEQGLQHSQNQGLRNQTEKWTLIIFQNIISEQKLY